ncbi:hypothetical protein [Cryobacterium sp. Hh11]|uniref:hypothetical protein n=1 Tax=Cryobacterium sp. Hh11 TaxID=2555868 RepID=UPI00141B97CD|nr:hypothetical protein [Cryobacterium sp. Hh11]
MTVANWSQVLFGLGWLLIFGGAWFLIPALTILGAALMLPMMTLVYLYVRTSK